jgi:hypothetical protein
MADFPSLTIEGVTIPRVICGTNALLGWSHVSAGRDAWVKKYFTPERIAAVFAKCIELGVTAVMGPLFPRLMDALEETEKLTGVRMTWVSTTSAGTAPEGMEEQLREAFAAGRIDEAMAMARESTRDQAQKLKAAGAPICFFHGAWVDRWPAADGCLEDFDRFTRMIREAGVIPGAVSHISTRLAEVDQGDYDVAVLATPVNKTGWNMRPSRDEAVEVIGGIQKPLLAIKTLACGRFEERHVGDWLKWAVDVEGVQAVAIGVMVEEEAEESIPVLRDHFAEKFG